ERHMDISAEAGLTPVAMFFGVPRYAIWDDNQLLWLTGLSPQIVNGSLTWSSLYRGRLGAGLVLPSTDHKESPGRLLLLGDNKIWSFGDVLHREPRPYSIGWTPDVPEGSGLRQPVVSWLNAHPEEVEFAGINREGVACWSRLSLEHDGIAATNDDAAERYRAVTIVQHGLVAAVSDDAVQWLQCGQAAFTK